MADIGGRTWGAEGEDVFEEGLRIPIVRLIRKGEMDPVLREVIAANVRAPEMVLGDLQAMATANHRAEARLASLFVDTGLSGLEGIAEEICSRSEAALRDRIRALPDGEGSGEIRLDGFSGPIALRATVTVDGDRLAVDYTGTSGQVREGINVVMTYTHAYTTYALACILSPEVPHNAGSFLPISVTAPEGTVLNAAPPAPVAARHIVGHFLPGAVYAALGDLIPGRVPADGAYGLWASQFEGRRTDGSPFVFTLFSNGGSGARPGKDGLSATSCPSGVQNIPVEIIESTTPLLVHERALRPGSGGEGMYRGGLGQVLTLSVRDADAVHSCIYERTLFPAGIADYRVGGTGHGAADGFQGLVDAQLDAGAQQQVFRRIAAQGQFREYHHRLFMLPLRALDGLDDLRSIARKVTDKGVHLGHQDIQGGHNTSRARRCQGRYCPEKRGPWPALLFPHHCECRASLQGLHRGATG